MFFALPLSVTAVRLLLVSFSGQKTRRPFSGCGLPVSTFPVARHKTGLAPVQVTKSFRWR